MSSIVNIEVRQDAVHEVPGAVGTVPPKCKAQLGVLCCATPRHIQVRDGQPKAAALKTDSNRYGIPRDGVLGLPAAELYSLVSSAQPRTCRVSAS